MERSLSITRGFRVSTMVENITTSLKQHIPIYQLCILLTLLFNNIVLYYYITTDLYFLIYKYTKKKIVKISYKMFTLLMMTFCTLKLYYV